MKLFALTFITALALALPAVNAAEWSTDYKASLALAAKENKDVLLDFTGSDWCMWCKKLESNTFSKSGFKKFADEKLILVKVDYPMGEPQTEDVKKQNEKLAEEYKTKGIFPTLVLLSPKGKEIARNVGDLAGGPEGFITWYNAQKQ